MVWLNAQNRRARASNIAAPAQKRLPSASSAEPALVDHLVSIGVGHDMAARACIATNNRGMSAAIKWTMNHFVKEVQKKKNAANFHTLPLSVASRQPTREGIRLASARGKDHQWRTDNRLSRDQDSASGLAVIAKGLAKQEFMSSILGFLITHPRLATNTHSPATRGDFGETKVVDVAVGAREDVGTEGGERLDFKGGEMGARDRHVVCQDVTLHHTFPEKVGIATPRAKTARNITCTNSMPINTLRVKKMQMNYPQPLNVFNSPTFRAKLSNNISLTPRNMTPPVMTPQNRPLSPRPLSVIPTPVVCRGGRSPPNVKSLVSTRAKALVLPPGVTEGGRQRRASAPAPVGGVCASGGVGRGAWQRSGVTLTPRSKPCVTQELTATKEISEIISEVSSLRKELTTFICNQNHSPVVGTMNGSKENVWRVFPTDCVIVD